MEQLTKNQAVATSQEAVQNQNEPQLRDENAHNDKSVHGVLNPTYQAGLRRDAVQPDIEAERKKRDEIEAGKSYCSRRFGGATCDDKSAQIYARFDKNDWRIQPAEFYRFHDAEVNTLDRKSGSAGMPRPISYAVFCLKKKKCALYEADHVVSIINPAQIRDFVRTKLGRNKTDRVDASHIREYCELFKPSPWAPPSEAHRRLGELQTIRSGIIAGLTEWKNRKNSGIVDAEAQALAAATVSHFTSQLGAVDKAIALTIDNDCDLQSKRDLLLSISGVGETLAGVVLAELPGPDVLRSSAEVVAYAGLNPRRHQSGTCIDRATRISKIGNAVLRAALYMPALSAMRYNSAIVALVTRLKSRGRLKPKQIVVAAMRKLLVLCFGVLKTGRPFDAAIAMGG